MGLYVVNLCAVGFSFQGCEMTCTVNGPSRVDQGHIELDHLHAFVSRGGMTIYACAHIDHAENAYEYVLRCSWSVFRYSRC